MKIFNQSMQIRTIIFCIIGLIIFGFGILLVYNKNNFWYYLFCVIGIIILELAIWFDKGGKDELERPHGEGSNITSD